MNTFKTFVALVSHKTFSFLSIFFAVVLVTYTFLYLVDFYPEPVTTTEEVVAEATTASTTPVQVVEETEEVPPVAALPLSITIPELDRTVKVLNPASREVADLDAALLEGAVRHPDSATFERDGNMFILGHSSYLPNVFNRNFQAFNGIQHLDWGDYIYVDSEDVRYVYRVEDVYEANAADVVVPHTPGEARLTLATCDSFAGKDDRFIVEAVLIETEEL